MDAETADRITAHFSQWGGVNDLALDEMPDELAAFVPEWLRETADRVETTLAHRLAKLSR